MTSFILRRLTHSDADDSESDGSVGSDGSDGGGSVGSDALLFFFA